MATAEPLSGPAPEDARQRLSSLREALLKLHKALLDSERTAYEMVHGAVQGPGAFLQLLINDNRFAWLRPITTLVVHIDEALAAKRPPASNRDFERLIEDTRALLSPSREGGEFWNRYSASVERDPAVKLLQTELERRF
ncbi:MAG: hypothetical protein WA324_30390 [Bryobacteraceae bacterium]